MNRNLRGRISLTLALVIVCISIGLSAAAAQQNGEPLLVVVSVDGMRPDYVTEADARGAKVPNQRRFLKEGAFADGVQGVVPTVTYPSHTTLVTGVWPAKHGIYANSVFDPLQKNADGWYWYNEDLRVPTLWDAVKQAGRKTASIQWPVTVGARNIDWLIPEVWRAGTPEDAKLLRALSTPGLLAEISPKLGDYRGGFDATPEADALRGKYAEWILEYKHPGILTLHLLALDHEEHESGPFSPQSLAVLERLDAVIGSLRETAERVSRGHAYVAVVSDHGFAKVENQLNLLAAFLEAKLFTLNDQGKIADWKAVPWETGGSAAIVLKDPADQATFIAVRDLLSKLAADSANGIDRVLSAAEVHERGGYPNAAFFVGLKPGWKTVASSTGPVASKTAHTMGTHGELPDLPDLRSSFFLVGPGVPANQHLGLVDMRSIAPTLAHLIGVSLPSADGKNLLPGGAATAGAPQ
jgi:predicted AlkP superfamily pyrophosphatase or phosphodiesterase